MIMRRSQLNKKNEPAEMPVKAFKEEGEESLVEKASEAPFALAIEPVAPEPAQVSASSAAEESKQE